MNILLVILCAGGVFFSFFGGDVSKLSEAAAQSAGDALELWMTVAAAMMFWGGLMRVAEKAGLVDKLCQIIRPMLSLLLKDVDKNSPAMKSVSLNVTANLLGLGNAAMPFGIEAMKRLTESGCSRRSIAVFVLLNTCSIQLIPMNIIMLRSEAGSVSAGDCILPVLVNSAAALCCGLLMTTILYGGKQNEAVRYGGSPADRGGIRGRGIQEG